MYRSCVELAALSAPIGRHCEHRLLPRQQLCWQARNTSRTTAELRIHSSKFCPLLSQSRLGPAGSEVSAPGRRWPPLHVGLAAQRVACSCTTATVCTALAWTDAGSPQRRMHLAIIEAAAGFVGRVRVLGAAVIRESRPGRLILSRLRRGYDICHCGWVRVGLGGVCAPWTSVLGCIDVSRVTCVWIFLLQPTHTCMHIIHQGIYAEIAHARF